jgi:iron complex outermembrane receptor protein
MRGGVIRSERACSLSRGLASAALAVLIALWTGESRAGAVLSADIKPQPLAGALAEFAHQTGLQLVYVSQLAKARVSKGARAGLAPAEALPALLEGTGLGFEFLNARTIRIFESTTAAPAPPKGAATPRYASSPRAAWIGTPDNEIFVTGWRDANELKIEEEVQNMAASVSMVSGDRLEAQNLEQLSDYAAYLPGLNMSTTGVPGESEIQLRGVGSSNNSVTLVYYIDDTPMGPALEPAWNPGLALELIPYDLERLEVLRGPQGTLGGQGSETGIIRYVLNEPDLSAFEARAGADISTMRHASQPGSSFQGMANVPIIDDVLAVRASGYDSYRPGFIENLYSGAKDVNVFRRYGGRITALWRPADTLSLKVTAFWNRLDAGSNDLVLSTGIAAVPDAGDANIVRVSNTWVQFTQDFAFLPTDRTDFRFYAASLHWNPGPVDIFSTVSWSRYQRHTVFDTSSGTGSTFPDLSGGAIPAGLANQQDDNELDKISGELRITSPHGQRIDWLLGCFFTDEQFTERLGEYAFDNNYQPIASFAPALWVQVQPTTSRNAALFGDLTWRLSNRFDMSGGIRYDHNDQSFSVLLNGSTIGEPVALSGQYSEGVMTWSTTSRYHLSPEVMFYGHVATASHPGSTNGPGFPPVQAERLTSYEMGLKSEFLDRKGMIDFTVFYIDWRDIQLSAQDPVKGTYWVNGGTVVSRGVELASSWAPMHALKFGYNATYTRDGFTKLDPGVQYYMVTGYQLPQVPTWSMSFTANYDWALTGLWHAHVGGAWRWTGSQWAAPVGSRSLGGERSLELPAYSLVDLNANVSKGPLTLRSFVRNLTDSHASWHDHDPTIDPSTMVAKGDAFIVQPRTIGIGVDYAL